MSDNGGTRQCVTGRAENGASEAQCGAKALQWAALTLLQWLFVDVFRSIHSVPGAGFEPARPFGQWILSPPRLPFRHPGLLDLYAYEARPTQQEPNIERTAASMTTRSEAKVEKFKPVTVEKGIRQIGPSRWEVRVYVRRNPETGKVEHVNRNTTKGIADARKIRARLTTEVDQGLHGRNSGTFGAILDDWLRDGRQGRAATTLDGYRTNIESTIRPALGAIMLDKLTAKDLDAFYADLIRDGTSPAMVMHHHRVISAALRQAEKWGSVPASVARNATPPRVPVKALTIPPPERVRDLIDAAGRSRTPEMSTIIMIAALTGMRRGEIAGLRWTDIDWQGSSLTVHRSVWQTKEGWGHKDPKTHQVRRLVLGELAMKVLASRKMRVDGAVGLAEIRLAEDAYVFSDALDGARPVMPNTLTNRFKNLCRKMEEPALEVATQEGRDLRADERWSYRFHDLRHYTATELMRSGHNARTVADRLGHSDPALTLRVYTHNTDDQAVAAAASLEAGMIA